jgi:PKD repeat protein
VDVSNVDPVAVAGPDLEVDQDGYVTLDGGGSHDTASDNGSLLFKWTFSDGLATNVTAHADVTRQFTEVGVVEATLTVHDPHGGETWDALEVTVVNVAPTVSTGPGLNISEDTAATFDGQGTDTPSHIDDLRYRWDFGDFTGTDWMMSPEAAHAYTRSGNYTATLSVRDPEGAMGSTTTVVRVINEVPVGTIVYPVDGSSFDKEVPVEFKATGRDTPSDEVDLLFMWDFGDGTASDWLGRRDTEVFYTYTAGGVRHVTLTVKDTDGAVHTTTATITIVNAPPEATVLRPWPSATVSEDARVDFKGTATDTPGDQADLLYEWTIEGQTYDAASAAHTFNRSGVYDCVFRATDPDGATGTVTVQVTVENVAPEATLEIDRTTIEAGESVTYTVHLLDTPSDLEDLFVTWDFGDGGTDHAANGTHPYPSAGIFLVRVTVEDDDGETAVASVSVTVTEPATGPDHPDGGNGHEDGDDGTMGTWLVIAVILVVLGIIGVILLLVHRSSREGLFKKDDG